LAVPGCLCGLEKNPTCGNTGALVIDAEKSRTGVWYLDCDQRDLGFSKDLCQLASNALVGLKLDCQIDVLVDQLLRTGECRFDTIAILYLNQVDGPVSGSPAQSLYECASKRMMGLRRVTDAETLAAHNPNIGCVFSPVAVAQQSFVNEGSQQSETDGSFQAGALNNIRQGKGLPVILKQAKNGTCAGNGLKSVLRLE
jgi:hypothetical protein